METDFDLSFAVVPSEDLNFARRRMEAVDPERIDQIGSKVSVDIVRFIQTLQQAEPDFTDEEKDLYIEEFAQRLAVVCGRWKKPQAFEADELSLVRVALSSMTMQEVLARAEAAEVHSGTTH